MNVKEAARYLFVSRPHVRRLLERGDLTGTPVENGDYVIDDASVEKYAARKKLAAKEYLDSASRGRRRCCSLAGEGIARFVGWPAQGTPRALICFTTPSAAE